MQLGLQCGQVPPSEWLRDIGSKRSLESAVEMLSKTWGITDITAENIVKGIFPIAVGDRELVVTMPDGWHWQVTMPDGWNVTENESE